MQTFFQLRVRWAGLVVATGVIASVATICALFASRAWFLDLFSHFRVQYAIGLAVCSLLIASRYRTWCACFAIGALVNVLAVVPLFFHQKNPLSSLHPPVRVLLINVNTRSGDPARISAMLRSNKPDVVVLEEVNQRWLASLQQVTDDYPYSATQPRGDNFGIALFSRFPLSDTRVEYFGDSGVPTLVSRAETDQGPFLMVATHPVPPAGATNSRARNSQLEGIASFVQRSEISVIVIGDLNITPWSPHFERLLDDGGLQDSVQGFGLQPTWPTWMPLLMIPIDHCLHSDDIRTLSRRLGPYVGSDHLPLIVDLAMQKAAAGDDR